MTRRKLAVAGACALGALAIATLIGSVLGAPLWARALRATIIDTSIVLATSLAAGVPLGFFAGSGVRFADTALGRCVELAATLPPALFAAALLHASGQFYVGALGLGSLRAVELAWLLRAELFAERQRLSLADQSRARLPFSVYFRRALPRSLGPTLTAAALTPVWLSVLDASAVALAAAPVAGRVSLGTAAAGGSAAATLTVAALTGSLYVVARHFTERLVAASAEDEEPVALTLRRRAPGPEAGQ